MCGSVRYFESRKKIVPLWKDLRFSGDSCVRVCVLNRVQPCKAVERVCVRVLLRWDSDFLQQASFFLLLISVFFFSLKLIYEFIDVLSVCRHFGI